MNLTPKRDDSAVSEFQKLIEDSYENESHLESQGDRFPNITDYQVSRLIRHIKWMELPTRERFHPEFGDGEVKPR